MQGVCTPEQFAAFFSGFQSAHPLISVVDVGFGKEAADHKIRGGCTVLQCKPVD